MNEPVSAIVPNSCRPVAYIRGADFYKAIQSPNVDGRREVTGKGYLEDAGPLGLVLRKCTIEGRARLAGEKAGYAFMSDYGSI